MAARIPTCRLEVFLVSLAALLLEIGYTRIFSFKVSSYFTYLLIGFALLGIGSGGVLVSVASGWRRRSAEQLLPRLAFGTALAIVLGYLVVARIELSTFSPPTSLGQVTSLAAVCLAVFTAFAGVGLIVSAGCSPCRSCSGSRPPGACWRPRRSWRRAGCGSLPPGGGAWCWRAAARCSSSGRVLPTGSPRCGSIRRRRSRPATWSASTTAS